VSDAFIPEADGLDQRREVTWRPDSDDAPESALPYGRRLPREASEADVLDQDQSVYSDDEE
jgi:hypothetical protein